MSAYNSGVTATQTKKNLTLVGTSWQTQHLPGILRIIGEFMCFYPFHSKNSCRYGPQLST